MTTAEGNCYEIAEENAALFRRRPPDWALIVENHDRMGNGRLPGEFKKDAPTPYLDLVARVLRRIRPRNPINRRLKPGASSDYRPADVSLLS
jgi:hypothetical protein